jgi:hypothetical protein
MIISRTNTRLGTIPEYLLCDPESFPGIEDEDEEIDILGIRFTFPFRSSFFIKNK